MGGFNITGNISPYIQSYFTVNCEQPIDDGEIYVLLPVILIVFVIMFPLSSHYSKTMHPRA